MVKRFQNVELLVLSFHCQRVQTPLKLVLMLPYRRRSSRPLLIANRSSIVEIVQNLKSVLEAFARMKASLLVSFMDLTP